MLLHHYLTIILMFNCFVHRQYMFGIPILLLHDLTDSLVNLMRIVREIQGWDFMVLPVYAIFVLSWIFTRNIIFNVELVSPLFSDQIFKFIKDRRHNHLFATFGVFVLMMLNTYWILGILYSGYRKIFKGDERHFLEEGEKEDKNKSN